MGKAEREKGKRGEREFAGVLRSLGFGEARRTAQYCGKTGDADDVVGVDGYHIEVKRCEAIKIGEWMKQAERDCGEKVPVVVFRRSGEKWQAVIAAEELFSLIRILEACHAHQE